MNGRTFELRKLRVALKVVVVACALSPSLSGLADDDPHNAVATDEPFTQEQIEVYSAVLENYRRGDKESLNLANATEPLEKPDAGCANFNVESNSALVVHRFDKKLASHLKVVLVDPDSQRNKIEQSDPQILIKSAIDEGKHVTEEQLDNSVRAAFARGLFTFSEIGFDKEHRLAVVAYSFVCGGLCGHGNTVVLGKVHGKWKVKKLCGGWVS